MPINTSGNQDRQIADARSSTENLIDIIEELDKRLTEADEKIQDLEEQLEAAKSKND